MNGHQPAKVALQPIQGGRKFYEIPAQNIALECSELNQSGDHEQSNPAEFSDYINSNIIGNNTSFESPFGHRRIIYCDHVASGKSLEFIEDFLRYISGTSLVEGIQNLPLGILIALTFSPRSQTCITL